MKGTTRKEIEQIAESWHKRAQKLAEICKSPHTDPKKKQKAFRLMSEMSVRLTKMALILKKAHQQKPSSKLIKL